MASELPEYPTVDMEWIVTENPQIILKNVGLGGRGVGTIQKISKWEYLRHLTARQIFTALSHVAVRWIERCFLR